MTDLVGYLLIFVAAGIGFLLVNMLVGWLVRPAQPDPEKQTIYECGEPTVGSSWIQFDLRFYVVALLFVVFDVELALLFPWAVVFGQANRAAESAADAGTATAAHQLAVLAFVDLLVFFGVILVGFAYLWRRGDLDWVRSTAAQADEPEA
jgi:NADH-quinone oxidoreductase subunit A